MYFCHRDVTEVLHVWLKNIKSNEMIWHNQNKNSNKYPSKEKLCDRIELSSLYFSIISSNTYSEISSAFIQITEEEKQILNNWSTEKFHINLKFEADRSTSSGLMLSDEAISSECLETLKHLIVAQSWQSYHSEVSPLEISEHLVQLARARKKSANQYYYIINYIIIYKHNTVEINIFTST